MWLTCSWLFQVLPFPDHNFKLALPAVMISLRIRHKSKLYLRAAMVIVTIIFGCIIFCGSKSNNYQSTAYNYGGLEEIEFHQALPGRLFFYQINSFSAPAALTISPIVNVLSPKSFGPTTTFAIVRAYNVFNRTITINAP